jgi:hypothetical protein
MPYIIPNLSKTIPDPGNANLPVPATGKNLAELDQYWYRRLEDGDIAVFDTEDEAHTYLKEVDV